MKCLLLADNRPETLDALEPILKHWGYRVLAVTKVEQVSTFLAESEPCMLIVGGQLLGDPVLALQPEVIERIQTNQLPLVMLKQEGAAAPPVQPTATLDLPVDIFTLFALIQKHVEQHPRQNLRLRLRLPGMYRSGNDQFILTDVLSLSMRGLFFKTATRLKKGDRLTVVIPLLGHCKELELEAEVLYVVQPDLQNNFAQGFGVAFTKLNETDMTNLQHFIEDRFLNEVSASQPGVGQFSQQSLRR